jgi:hypothetical protein
MSDYSSSRARLFKVFKDLVKHVDFEDALYYREGEELPQVTIRIGDKLVPIAHGGQALPPNEGPSMDRLWEDRETILAIPPRHRPPDAIRGWHCWSRD